MIPTTVLVAISKYLTSSELYELFGALDKHIQEEGRELIYEHVFLDPDFIRLCCYAKLPKKWGHANLVSNRTQLPFGVSTIFMDTMEKGATTDGRIVGINRLIMPKLMKCEQMQISKQITVRYAHNPPLKHLNDPRISIDEISITIRNDKDYRNDSFAKYLQGMLNKCRNRLHIRDNAMADIPMMVIALDLTVSAHHGLTTGHIAYAHRHEISQARECIEWLHRRLGLLPVVCDIQECGRVPSDQHTYHPRLQAKFSDGTWGQSMWTDELSAQYDNTSVLMYTH